jgi:hypothetical protein
MIITSKKNSFFTLELLKKKRLYTYLFINKFYFIFDFFNRYLFILD